MSGLTLPCTFCGDTCTIVKGCEPFSIDQWQCNKCDSTYCIQEEDKATVLTLEEFTKYWDDYFIRMGTDKESLLAERHRMEWILISKLMGTDEVDRERTEK